MTNPLSNWFKPQVNKKSELLDKKAKEKLNMTMTRDNRSVDRSLERPLMMLEKGLKYKERVQKMRQEKSSKETDGCTFTP